MDGVIATRKPSRIDGPNHNELARLDYLADQLAKAVMVAQHYSADRISFHRDLAEELLQAMNDGIRTAKQLQEQAKPDWRTGPSGRAWSRSRAVDRASGRSARSRCRSKAGECGHAISCEVHG